MVVSLQVDQKRHPERWSGVRRRRWSGVRRRRLWKLTLTWALALLYFMPLLWMVKSSLQTDRDIRVTDLRFGLSNPTLDNYVQVLTSEQFLTWFSNSMIVSLSTMVMTVFICSTAAYSLARLPNPVTRILGRFFLLAYIAPGLMLIIPLFVLATRVGLQNTHLGLIITYASFAVPFGIWILVGYFRSLDFELEEAAMIDGCSRLGAFWRIVLPLSAPALVSVALWAFVLAWNDLLFAIVFTQSDDMLMLSSGLVTATASVIGGDSATGNAGGLGLGGVFAICVIIAAPVMVVFVILQKWLVGGLSAGSLKG